ncbi:S41 family peptidase, partial [Arthrospira platensis SPKY1]|nr:S41 family peptidase [Arthrospira platensis SPKY1]
MTEQPIEMHYQNPTEGSRVSYFVEVETNAYENINWFILTSRVTFSAANLMTSIAKQQGFATIIGTTSGGGASSITPIVLPNGAFYTMSSLNVLSYRTGSDEDGWTYYSI